LPMGRDQPRRLRQSTVKVTVSDTLNRQLPVAPVMRVAEMLIDAEAHRKRVRRHCRREINGHKDSNLAVGVFVPGEGVGSRPKTSGCCVANAYPSCCSQGRLLFSVASTTGNGTSSRIHSRSHLSGRQYSRLVCDWVEGAGLDSDVYGTQSLRRTKVLLIVQTTGNLKAAQLLLGHTKIESAARYLETELNAALKISEKVEL
jgi:hypothetical protein